MGKKRCPHGRPKHRCKDCNPCPHGKVKNSCAKCNPCPHGKLKSICTICKTARAGQPSSKRIKREPEIKQEAFAIQSYFGFNK